jgi:hypothetical protein
MKKIRMGFIALAALTGLGGAFAFTPKHHAVGAIYYGYKDANGNARWTVNQPTDNCLSDPKGLACTITSTSSGVTSLVNQFPAQHTIVNGAGDLYK